MTRDDHLTFDGTTQPISEWALDYGILPEIILARLERGLSVAQAITMPMKVAPGQKLPARDAIPASKQQLRYAHDGLSLAEWSKRTGIPIQTLYDRIRRGRTLAEAIAMPHQRRGVVSNLEAFSGTGAGESAQETPEITFSQKADPA